MRFEVRRVVTGYDDHGDLVVSSDAAIVSLGKTPAGEAVPVWAANAMPVPLDDAGEHERPSLLQWYLVRVPPDKERGAAAADYQPGILHEGATIDLVAVVSGEVWLELDGVEDWVRLRAGETIVQRGTKHAWHNPTDATVMLSCVILSGVRTEATPSRISPHDRDFTKLSKGTNP
jgi:hypothetical protein